MPSLSFAAHVFFLRFHLFFLAVDRFWREGALVGDFGGAVGLQHAEKAAAIAFVADAGADGFDADQKSIGVAIDAKLSNFQDVAAGLAFFPEFVARAAEENHFAGALRFGERGRVHEAEHEDVTGAVILNDRGNEAAGFVEIDFKIRAAHGACLPGA